ncbi:MAG: glycosyltransferase family 4 protein [Verrucomicrobia bacterium]|nr:glycosyltransferase family 4 protein [Verrucomicrobiota bacterium]
MKIAMHSSAGKGRHMDGSALRRSLRIGIDGHAIGSRLGGNETYLRGVLKELAGYPAHRYFVYVNDNAAAAIVHELLPTSEVRLLGGAGAVARLGWKLTQLARADQVDVLHVQYVAPVFGPASVVTIHDLSFRHFPEWYTRAERWRFELTVPWSGRRARRVLTVSEFCKRDIVQQLRIAEKRVIVSYNKIDEQFRPVAAREVERSLADLGARPPYIVSVANLQPRKNLPRLIGAWEQLRQTHAQITPKLVIVGRKAWLFEETLAAVRQSRWRDEIVLTDYVPHEQLPPLYAGAELLIYPSLFEGFGLPPLEAMACGTPVVVSNTSSLPEVCGEAAEFVDPRDVKSIADGMLRLLRDSDLRESRRAAGLKQAEKFRTGQLGAATVRAYEEAAAEVERLKR